MVPGTKYYVFLRIRALNYGLHLGVQSTPNVLYPHPRYTQRPSYMFPLSQKKSECYSFSRKTLTKLKPGPLPSKTMVNYLLLYMPLLVSLLP